METKEEFCVVDLWAAEAYITAIEAGEPYLLAMLDRGEKIHNWMWTQVNEKYPEEVTKAHYDYKKAKQSVHALNYGVRAQKMAQESGLPIHVCDWQHRFYHQTFPGIQKRQARIRQEIESTHTLTSLLGRKRFFFMQMSEELLNIAYAWPSQSVIGELTNRALVKLMFVGQVIQDPWMFPALNTHDGLAIRFRGSRDSVKKRVRDAFCVYMTKFGRSVVIPVECGFAPNFNDVSDKEIIRYE